MWQHRIGRCDGSGGDCLQRIPQNWRDNVNDDVRAAERQRAARERQQSVQLGWRT
jgi:hypothetical protein